MPKSATSESGYSALRLHIRGRSFESQLFARLHVSRADDAELPQKRTLFVLNVPPRATSEALTAAFGAAGEVVLVRLSGSAAARSAHVVFGAPAGLKKALASKRPLELELGEYGAAGTSSELPAATATLSREELDESVNSFMLKFEAAEEAQEKEDEARHNQMDADGFVVVTRKKTGRSTSTDAASGATVQVAGGGGGGGGGDEEEEGGGRKKKRKKGKDMTDFYHFQQHEKKREHLLKMRDQFEADKARIVKMRNERKFKPAGY